jgi:hypothetical protein
MKPVTQFHTGIYDTFLFAKLLEVLCIILLNLVDVGI